MSHIICVMWYGPYDIVLQIFGRGVSMILTFHAPLLAMGYWWVSVITLRFLISFMGLTTHGI